MPKQEPEVITNTNVAVSLHKGEILLAVSQSTQMMIVPMPIEMAMKISNAIVDTILIAQGDTNESST